MGWTHPDADTDSADHEGELVAVLPGGVDAPVATYEEHEQWDWAWMMYDGQNGRQRATGIRMVCACGWKGTAAPADFQAPKQAVERPLQEWARHTEAELSRDLPQQLQRVFREIEWQLDTLTGVSYEMVMKRRGKGGSFDFQEFGEVRPLAVLSAATELRRIADSYEAQAVREAREAGYSWADIGRAEGITKQSAHERLRERLRHLDTAADHQDGAEPTPVTS